ncbi:hypothetical protein ScPMuIL_017633 [Solemya velum]
MTEAVYAYEHGLLPDPGATHDLSCLNILDENIILEELRVRFNNDKFYTFLGDVLIAVNPNKKLHIYDEKQHLQFDKDDTSAKQPHIFWTPQQAYCNFLYRGRHQCILVSGESGTGKTDSAKLIVKHLAYMSTAGDDVISDKILKASHLLEAFGNAVTPMNQNSSRFGKYVQLFFTDKGFLSGAKVTEYMLEKSRLVSRNDGESNFHVLYYMLAGLSPEVRASYCLDPSGNYRILQNVDRTGVLEKQKPRDTTEVTQLCSVMGTVGFTDKDIANTVRSLAIILHLTTITFFDDGSF